MELDHSQNEAIPCLSSREEVVRAILDELFAFLEISSDKEEKTMAAQDEPARPGEETQDSSDAPVEKDKSPAGDSGNDDDLNSCSSSLWSDIGSPPRNIETSSDLWTEDDANNGEEEHLLLTIRRKLLRSGAKLDNLFDVDEMMTDKECVQRDCLRASNPCEASEDCYYWPMNTLLDQDNSDKESFRTKLGLVDLDELYPCTQQEPCLLDRLIYEEYVGSVHQNGRSLHSLLGIIMSGTKKVVKDLTDAGF